MTKKTPAQLDAEIAEALAASTATAKYRPPTPKRRAYDINPSSPEVIQAFMKSGYPADEVGIQEFIAKRYRNWMRLHNKGYMKGAYTTDPSDVWAEIIREFTAALERHFKHEDDGRTGHATAKTSGDLDTTTTLEHKFRARQRDALTLSEKARQARGAAARWNKRSSALAREGQFREADDAQTEAVALGHMADTLEAEASRIRTSVRR